MKKFITIFTILIAFLFLNQTRAQGTWTQKAQFGGGAISEACAFSIGSFGYFGGATAALWQYDPVNDLWTQMATFLGGTRLSAVGFSIGSKGYIGTGNGLNDFFEYDQQGNAWTQKASFGGSGREGALGISINGKGYIGTGGNYLNDWWEYDATADTWTQKANIAGPGRYHGGAFSINNKGYVSCGFNGSFYNDLWQYDPILNSWSAKASMPGTTRDRPVGISTSTKGYIITGWTGSAPLTDAWEYDPVTDIWTALPSMPVAGRYNSCGFSIGNNVYIGTGYMNGNVADFWQFGPDCSAVGAGISSTCGGICNGIAAITFPDSASVVSYLWSNSGTTQTISNLCAGTYTATVTDTSGCVSVVSVIVNQPAPITAIANATQPTCFGDVDGILCAVPSITPATFLWSNGDTTACLQGIAAGTYMVTVTDSLGCNGTVPLTLSQPAVLALNFSQVNASCPTCNNGSASAQVSGGTSPFTYQWSNGSTLSFLINLLPGVYSCCVTDVNGCSQCDSVTITFTSGINNINDIAYSLFPIPFKSELSVIFPVSETGAKNVMIYDNSGKLCNVPVTIFSERIVLNTNELTNGLYCIRIITEKGNIIRKIIRQ